MGVEHEKRLDHPSPATPSSQQQQQLEQPILSCRIAFQVPLVNGLPEGEGTVQLPDGSQYSGQWLKGKRDGRGTYCANNGTTYTGMWRSDAMVGPGVLTLPNGTEETGVWTEQGEWVRLSWQRTRVAKSAPSKEASWKLGQQQRDGSMVKWMFDLGQQPEIVAQ